jgi:DNA polymerase-1
MPDLPFVAFDTETFLIEPGRLAPRLVCVTVYDGIESRLLTPKDGLDWFELMLKSDRLVVAHSAAFDVGVMVQARPELMPLVWKAYDEGRIVDTVIVEQLYFIEKGWYKSDPDTSRPPSFSLKRCVERHFGESVEGKTGEDAWRLRYHELIDLDLRDWPRAAKDYAIKDAEYAWRLHTSQLKKGISEDTIRQCQSAWSLHLISAWGLRTDPEVVDELEAQLKSVVDETVAELLEAGLYKESKDGKLSKNMAVIKAMVSEAHTGDPPKTPKGSIKTDVATLEASGNEILEKLASISNDQKLLNTYVPVLRAGTERPLMPRYFMAESGRTTCRSPNIQNQPRKGGVREAFIPRAGHVYVACDYHVAELASLAQVLLHKFGQSNLADALNSGRDLHLEMAAAILGNTYEETVELYQAGDRRTKDARQMAKACSFGFPGGLGARTFCDFARDSYGVEISLEQSQQLKERWLGLYPEMQLYFDHISEALGFRGKFTAKQLYSNRVRGDLGYCDGCNTYFQGLTADGARRALYDVVKHTYVAGDPLEGCHVVAFIHDEVILEAPSTQAADAANRLSQLMVEGMRYYLKDMKVRATPHLMKRWYKDAEPSYNESGTLIPWEPNQGAD